MDEIKKEEEKNKINEKDIEIPQELPILAVRDIVIFPYMIIPLFVGRDISVKAVEHALNTNRLILLLTQKDFNIEVPEPSDLYNIGTICMIMRMLRLPDGRLKILVQGISKAKAIDFYQSEGFYMAKIEKIEDEVIKEITIEHEALIRTVKEQLEKVISLGKNIPPDAMVIIENIDEPGRLADLIASNLGLKSDQAQEILEINNPIERLKKINEILNREIQLLTIQQKIQKDAKNEIDKTQREYFLREQLKAIQRELGDIDEKAEEINEFRKKIEEAKMPEKVKEEAEKQLKRLERMHPESAESAVIRTYLEWLTELPWSRSTEDRLDIKAAKDVLDKDHYDLEKVKERILEYLSVRKLKEKMKGPILCFIGPPGVGKTSLGRSIAKALGREFVRISLGGVRDEAEIRGHRRTYVGALPGRIIQGIRQAGTNNPVFMLDEIDKLGMDFRGDPSSALLEVLDPEQNNSFVDHYLAVPFDLSKVMFVCTGNIADTIPSALKDRMEIIYLSGYTEEEKLQIAKKYLIPKQLEEHGLNSSILKISDKAIRYIITHHTREAGVRNLEREIANLCRKVAKYVAEGKKKKFYVTAQKVSKFLGAPKYLPEEELKKEEVGVATGLAWTEAGGDVIYVEATIMKGKGNLILTGQLGDVMKESAQAALSYVKSKAKELKIDEKLFSTSDLHIHVPAGAIPKDGPSAGITMASAIASCFTGKPLRKDVAMTGEITLRGRVLPIGGLKEKVLAAKRMGIKTVIIPKRNKKDLDELPKYVKEGMKFALVETMDEVLKHIFSKAKTKSQPQKVAAKAK
ncbi:MAG: endopeptidase La [Thermodesulfovibrio sp.]|uniref:endopeptidase La n=1 Tax=unclassified Thermodesulfovibrio TaxID=2645936 RepID=UPI00083A3348|nr:MULTISPECIES: endopeptidase La [unclassified Thermodesulfovibrio]MDI1471352.1 endopeptidase La [Thermodesulfovibrio sp. 1176]MDI6714622.1 endopeptidase La [Thermodesulfovibrio sp.]ODA44306.1 ATP-dependent protease La, Type I [Thermodesulfovibrio sp. N1]